MSREYGSREQQRTTSSSSASSVSQRDIPQRTPAERANDRIVEVVRDVDTLAPTIAALTQATAANDLHAWNAARGDLDRKLALTKHALEAAKQSSTDADASAKEKLAAAESMLADRAAQASAFVEAPRGWNPVSREQQILAVLQTPASGSVKDAYEHKEVALDAEFKQLSAVESRRLVARLQSRGKDDEIAAEFARLEPKRQRRLLAVLGGAIKREVVARANTSGTEVDGDAKIAETHAAPASAERVVESKAPVVPAGAPTLDDVETALAVMIDAGAPDSAVLARFDGTTLRDLARRLRGARPGQGFALGTRFNQLAHATREQFLTALETAANAPHADSTNNVDGARLQSHVATDAPVAVPDTLKLQPDTTPISSTAEATMTKDAAPVTASLDTVARGLSIVSNDLRQAIIARVATMDWPALGRFPRLALDARALDTALIEPLLAALGNFEAKRLASLLHPSNLSTTLAPYLTKDLKQLPPVVGTLVAQAIHGVLGMSVPRMAQRIVDVADAMYAANPTSAPRVLREQLITSHPMDAVVADALIATHAVVAPDADILSGKRKAPRVGLRDVQLEWMTGAQWNVVRANPADATPEEVMAKLYNYARHDKDSPGGPTSYYAYGVAAAAPFFSLPASWAIQFPEAKANAPAAVREGKLPDAATDTIEARLTALATSNVGDEIALREATPSAQPHARADVQKTLDEIFVQLDHLRGVFAPWGLSGPVIAEGVHVAILSGDLAKVTPDRLATLGAIFETQRDRLHSVADTMASLSRVVATVGPRAYNPSDPLHKIAATLANAAGSSHLGQTSEYLIEQAEAEQRAVTLRSLQSSEAALEQAQASEQLVATGGGTARQNSPAVGRTQEQLQQLENSLIGGGNVSPDQIERAQLSAQELTLNMRAHALQAQIDQLEDAWRKGSVGMIATAVTTQKYRDIGPVGLLISQTLGEVRLAFKTVELAPEDQREKLASDLAARRTAITTAQAAFDKLAKDRDLEHFFTDAYHTVKNQQIRTLIVQAAVMVGIAIATAGVAGAVAEGMGEAYMAAEGAQLAELSFGARAAIQVSSLATEVVGNAAGQTVTSNTPFTRALVDNAAFVLGSAGGAKMLEGIMQNAPAAAAFSKVLDKELALLATAEERSAMAMRELAKTGVGDAGVWAVKQGVAIAGHTVMGMAIGYVVERVHEHGNAQASSAQLGEWLVQGASVAVGRMFHAALGERMPNYARLAKQAGLRRGNELYQQAIAAQARAAALGAHSDPAATLAVMNDAIRLHEMTLEVLDEASQIKLGKGGPTHEQIEALKTDAKGQLDMMRSGEMLELRWKLHGLDSLGGGVWAGPPDRVQSAIDDARAIGLVIRSTTEPSNAGDAARWTLDGQQLELRTLASGKSPGNKRTGDGGSERTSADVPPSDLRDVREWADALANSNPKKMTPEAVIADRNAYADRVNTVAGMYEKAMTGELPTPSGVSKERLAQAVKGGSDGERIPLTYGSDPVEAKRTFHELQAELKQLLDSEGITDAVIVQLGSGTTGWSTAPGKTGKAWSRTSDVDFAIFSDQILAQAKAIGAKINPKNTIGDQYTTLRNTKEGAHSFEKTPIGGKLKALAQRWNQRVYGEDVSDGFDFKINLQTDQPFRNAVPVVQMETPIPLTTAISGTHAIEIQGRSPFFGVPVQSPKMAGRLPVKSASRREFHITLLSPDELAALPKAARSELEAGVDIPGHPHGRSMDRKDIGEMASFQMSVEWPEAQAFRQKLGLGPKELHVSLNGGIGKAIEARNAKAAVDSAPMDQDNENGEP